MEQGMKRNNPNWSEVTGSPETRAEGKGRPTGLPASGSVAARQARIHAALVQTADYQEWKRDYKSRGQPRRWDSQDD